MSRGLSSWVSQDREPSKMAELIEIPFRGWAWQPTRVVQGTMYYIEAHIVGTWRQCAKVNKNAALDTGRALLQCLRSTQPCIS